MERVERFPRLDELDEERRLGLLDERRASLEDGSEDCPSSLTYEKSARTPHSQIRNFEDFDFQCF